MSFFDRLGTEFARDALVRARRATTRALVLPTMTVILTAAPVAVAVTPRATLPVIERQVMCATCKIPLNVAESAQANRERAFIRNLIAQGQTEAQIKKALVDQYGPAVLALPSAKGFDLAAYLVPGAVVAALIVLLALLLPSWRRHARAQAANAPRAADLSASDASRLDADLERFD
jgi:cytochrome c-type biogenesis protein CcmH/NrfF